jgi:Uncharacterized protein conserved in bacteria
MPTEFKYEIEQQFGTLSSSVSTSGITYAKEVNLVAYGDAEPKYDIRNWTVNADGTRRMGKGITLSREEMNELKKVLEDMEEELKGE